MPQFALDPDFTRCPIYLTHEHMGIWLPQLCQHRAQLTSPWAVGIGKATHGLHRLPTVRGSSQFPPAAHNKVTPTVFRFINGCLRITNSSTTVGTPHTWAALTPRRSFCNFTTISQRLKGTTCMGSQKSYQLYGLSKKGPVKWHSSQFSSS